MTRYSRIIGTGGYLPEEVRTNEHISHTVDTSDSWIFERTGIKSRRIAGAHETASSMAEIAARQAIAVSGCDPEEIDIIIVATGTPDRVYPSTGCLLQQRLGIKNCVAFDVQAACSGSIFALSIADQYIKSGAAKKVLIVGSEICSRIVDWTDRSTCILFGDGAGAVLLAVSEETGILSTHIHSDGEYEDLLYCPNPQAAAGADEQQAGYINMRGNEVFKVAVNTLGRIVEETLDANSMDRSEIDWLVPHQANIRIIAATAKKLKMSMDQVVVTLETQGNTSSASVLLAFNEAVRDGRIQRGQVVLLEAFGAGFTWGSALIKY
ncbi:MAG: ketoacyl-ACP synthase III [Methylovulum sp.]|jgi:3-oxoacyl-[acyl-carrier-protein] synthase-3|nr:MAG: ketoacyl-ACP synthase III [Methylovulum sp.]